MTWANHVQCRKHHSKSRAPDEQLADSWHCVADTLSALQRTSIQCKVGVSLACTSTPVKVSLAVQLAGLASRLARLAAQHNFAISGSMFLHTSEANFSAAAMTHKRFHTLPGSQAPLPDTCELFARNCVPDAASDATKGVYTSCNMLGFAS